MTDIPSNTAHEDRGRRNLDDLYAGIPVPENLSNDEYEGVQSAILYNVSNGFVDPLLGLSDQTETDLVRLAFNDSMRLDRLERGIKAKIRERNDGEAAASKFTLASYRKAAKQIEKRIAEAHARVAKMRQRNMRILQGGKNAKEGTDVELPDETSFTVQAMAESTASFLRSAALLLELRSRRVWHDDFYGDYFTNWGGGEDDQILTSRRIDDAFILAVHGWLLMMDVKLGNMGTNTTEKVIHFVADKDHRSEPREWLRALEWDGVERLPSLLTEVYGAPDDEYHRAVGRCWFVSMAARVMTPGEKVDTMPVLFGPQGTSKSTSLQVVGGKWYATLNVSAESKDFVGTLPGLIVGEIAELDAISGRRVENSRVKTLLSTAEDLFRPPYGRTARRFLRTVVFVGTTNDPGWHRDETGGRRYWPVECAGQVDLEWLRENREQLFAEARVRYERKEKWWDVPREEQERRIMEHYTADPWEDKIATAISTWQVYRGPGSKVEPRVGDLTSNNLEARWGTIVTTARIAAQVLELPIERQQRATSNRIARAMRSLGWDLRHTRVKTLLGSKVEKVWIVTRLSGEKGAETNQKEMPIN